MEEALMMQEWERLSAFLTLPDSRSYLLQVRISFLVWSQVEPERSENVRWAFLYEKWQRPDTTFVIYILNKIVLEELANVFSKPFTGFHLHDNVNTEWSVVCWPWKIETTERAKIILKQWLGLIGTLTNSEKNDINELYDPNDLNWLDNVPRSVGVIVTLEGEQEWWSWRFGEGVWISPVLQTDWSVNPLRLEKNDDLIVATRWVVRFLPSNPSILYIASGTDVSLESIFPKQAITYLDPDTAVWEKLLEDRERNVVSEWIPTGNYRETHDMIVLVNKNWRFWPNDISPYLKVDWIILAQGNWWNFDAEPFLLSDQYRLIWVMDDEDVDFKEYELRDYTEIVKRDNNSWIERTEFTKMWKWYIFRIK